MEQTTRRNWFKGLAGLVVVGTATPLLAKERSGSNQLEYACCNKPYAGPAPTPTPIDTRTPEQVWEDAINSEVQMIVNHVEYPQHYKYINTCSEEGKNRALAIIQQRGEAVAECTLGGKPAFTYRGQTWRVCGS